MKYTSHCQWPPGTLGFDDDKSTDTHHSMEGALGVVKLLYRNGFGGDRKVFPVNAWAEETDSVGNIIRTTKGRPGRWGTCIEVEKSKGYSPFRPNDRDP